MLKLSHYTFAEFFRQLSNLELFSQGYRQVFFGILSKHVLQTEFYHVLPKLVYNHSKQFQGFQNQV